MRPDRKNRGSESSPGQPTGGGSLICPWNLTRNVRRRAVFKGLFHSAWHELASFAQCSMNIIIVLNGTVSSFELTALGICKKYCSVEKLKNRAIAV